MYFHISVKRNGKKKYFYLGSLFKKRKTCPSSPSADFSPCLVESHATPNQTSAKRDKTTDWLQSIRSHLLGKEMSSQKEIATWRATNEIKILLEGRRGVAGIATGSVCL